MLVRHIILIDKIAIMDYDGVCGMFFDLGGLIYARFDKRGKEHMESRKVPCLMLDSWISKYADEGFTERIDFLNCVVNCDFGSILDGFSFKPKPVVIMIRHPSGIGYPTRAIDTMERHGYFVSGCRTSFVGVRCD